VELARDWERRGVPVERVQRGITAGIRRFLDTSEPHAPLPSSLKYYRSSVEAEFESWQRARARGMGGASDTRDTRPGPDLAAVAVDALRAWRDAAIEMERREVFERAMAALVLATPGTPVAALLDRLDDEVAAGLVAASPRDTRDRVEAEVKDALDRAMARGLGRAAAIDLERAETRAAAARHAGFESLADAVLGA